VAVNPKLRKGSNFTFGPSILLLADCFNKYSLLVGFLVVEIATSGVGETFSNPIIISGIAKPQKDELEMFVDSMNRMATGFHRLEFRLTKAIKMIDKFVTAV
jgi:hypothetical protein